MTYKTHRVCSIAIATTFLKFNFYPSLYINGNATEDTLEGIVADAVFIGIVILGGMLPDIDNANSRIRRKIRKFTGNNNNSPENTHHQYNHRQSRTHWLFFWLLILGLLRSILSTTQLPENLIALYIYGIFAGIAGHMLCDLFNPGGIMLLAPFFTMRRFGLAKIPVGSSKENLFCAGLIAATLILIFIYLMNIVNMMQAMILGMWIISDFFVMLLRSSVRDVFSFGGRRKYKR